MEAGGSCNFGVAETHVDENSDGAATQPTPVAPFDGVEDALEHDLTRQDSDTELVVSASNAESNGSEGPPTAAIDTPGNVTLRLVTLSGPHLARSLQECTQIGIGRSEEVFPHFPYAMMPLLFASGQHEALQAANQNMREASSHLHFTTTL